MAEDTYMDAPPSPVAPQPSQPSQPRRARRRVVVALSGLVLALVAGNLVILGASWWARAALAAPAAPDIAGVRSFRVVDDRLWRGAAPSADGYRALAAAGVDTVVDLRGEENLSVDEGMLGRLGLRRIAIPIRDGQLPTDAQIDRFLAAVAGSERVFVHCGAGVGRTGTMVAAYLVRSGRADGWSAVERNLSVGPPSLEQIAFVAQGTDRRPSPVVVAVSRVLDAPRRLWSRARA